MTYDYECTHCGNKWEAEQKITDEPIKHCPACSLDRAKRLISAAPGHILKGDGWFKTGGY